MIRRTVYIGLLFFSFMLKGQIISSNTYIRTCLNDVECSYINHSSLLFYDENKNSFYLALDFNNFKTGEDTLDNWLDDLSETFLYYKAPFAPENFLGLSNNKQKSFKLKGQIYLNGIWQNQDITLSLYSSENSISSNSNIGNNYDNYKVNFSLDVIPKDFKIHKKAHHLKETIFIGVAMGRINVLKPESLPLIGEAYNH